MYLSWNLSISLKLSNSCIKLFLILPYNSVNIYRTHIKLITLTLDTGNVLLHSLPGQSVWWILQTFSKNSLLALLSFYRLLCFLFYWLLLSVHSSAKLGFHLRLFITFPDMEAEVTALIPFLFFETTGTKCCNPPSDMLQQHTATFKNLCFYFWSIQNAFRFPLWLPLWSMGHEEMSSLCPRLSGTDSTVMASRSDSILVYESFSI